MESSIELLAPSALNGIQAIILTETWATKPLNLHNFYAVNCSAEKTVGKGRPRGGVSVFYRQQIGKIRVRLAEDNCIVIEGDRINILAAYMRPEESTITKLEKITQYIQLIENELPTMLVGDFNVRLDKPEKASTITFTEAIADMGFWIVTDPTIVTFDGPQGKSVIGIFAMRGITCDRVRYIGEKHHMEAGGKFKSHIPLGVDIWLPSKKTPPLKPRTVVSTSILRNLSE